MNVCVWMYGFMYACTYDVGMCVYVIAGLRHVGLIYQQGGGGRVGEEEGEEEKSKYCHI